MPPRPYDMPPASSLISFEAAARKGSFKAAAQELNVTPAAISHQVKALEGELSCALFHRYHRGVELTESGAYLQVSLQRAFEGISESLTQLRAQHSRSSVTIRSTTAVSSLWLTPRLAGFWRNYGHISVAQTVSDDPMDASGCDLSIQYGDMSKDPGTCRMLLHGQTMALGSPGFAAQNSVTSVEDLAQVPLIHLAEGETEWINWADWAGALGYAGPLNIRHRVNNYVIALQAAQDDMGAVLGWEGLTSELVASGKLVPLLPETVPSPQDFYIRLHNQASDRARLVFDWLSRKPDNPA
jgi:DNA-binding transcriptional LysR family regulator